MTTIRRSAIPAGKSRDTSKSDTKHQSSKADERGWGFQPGTNVNVTHLLQIGLLWITNRRTGNQGAPKHSLLGE